MAGRCAGCHNLDLFYRRLGQIHQGRFAQMRVQKKTKVEYNQDIITAYIAENGDGEMRMRDVAAWAIRKGLWSTPRISAVRQCAKELAEAARQITYKDD